MPRLPAKTSRPLLTRTNPYSEARLVREEKAVEVHQRHYEEAAPPMLPDYHCGCGLPLELDGRCPDGHYRPRRKCRW